MKAGWQVKPLGEVCEVIAGQSPNGTAYNDQRDGLPFYQGKKEFTDRYLGAPTTWTTEITKIAEAGDILMSVRAPVGPVNVATERVCIGRGLAAIRPCAEIYDSYLWYSLLWMQPQITGNAGAVFSSINRSQICALSLPLPPLDEQKRIVAVLDEAFEGLDRARANAEANLADARELWASVLSKEFAPDRPGFTTQTLNDLAADDCSLSYGIVQPGDELPEGLPIVRPVDLGPDLITLDGLKRIAPDRARGYDRTRLKGGELLLCVRGTTGLTAVASEELAGANVTRGIVPIRFDERRVLSRFAEYQFASPFIQDQIAAKTYGAALMQINIGDLRKIIMAVPDIETQRDTVEKLDAIKQEVNPLLVLMQSRLSDLASLRQSLLQKAFSGELG